MSMFDAMYGFQNAQAQSQYDRLLREQMMNQYSACDRLGIARPVDAPQPAPVTNPEPNPVLLLLE